MKKIIAIFLGAVVLILAAFLVFNSGKWSTYHNARYNFSIRYPANWELGEEETNNAGRTLVSPDEEANCYAYGFANALTGKSGEPQTLNEFVDWLVEDTRVGEGLYTTVIERKNVKLDSEPAVYLFLEKDMGLQEAVYTLNSESGLGLSCSYGRRADKDKYFKLFQKILASFKINAASDKNPKEVATCGDLMAGVVTPLKDRQIFFDSNYNEVTITSRESWDQARLPKKVLNGEKSGYVCYPMPSEFDYADQIGDELAQPAVTKVEWSCELSYKEWHYVEESAVAGMKGKGLICEKQNCLPDGGGEDFVWLCTK